MLGLECERGWEAGLGLQGVQLGVNILLTVSESLSPRGAGVLFMKVEKGEACSCTFL